MARVTSNNIQKWELAEFSLKRRSNFLGSPLYLVASMAVDVSRDIVGCR